MKSMSACGLARQRVARRRRSASGHGAERLEPRLLLAAAPSNLADRVGDDLAFLYADYTTAAQVQFSGTNGVYRLSPAQPNRPLMQVAGDRVLINVISAGDDTTSLMTELTGAGAELAGAYGRVVSAYVPFTALASLAALPDLGFARPSYLPHISAQVEDQGVAALHSDVGSKRFGVDGTGVTVGVLSDSFNNLGGYAADVASGDLPSGVSVLSDLSSGGTDEGRAMAQIVHHLAPGSPLAFHTAFVSEADFAQGITDLANAGCKVIADDVSYFDEPMFQDGIVAQAVNNAVNNKGVSYFSAAGNEGRDSYEAAFSATTASPKGSLRGGASHTWHNFNPTGTASIYQPITVAAGDTIYISYQWDQPYASAGGARCQSDLDVYLYNSGKTSVLTRGITNNINGDPTEILAYTNSGGSAVTVNLAVNLYAGVAPGMMKYILFTGSSGSGIASYATNSGTIFGHPMATSAAAVGAAAYWQTPAFSVTPALKEGYSSAGGAPVLFDTAGVRLATPDYRSQPRFVTVDGTDTTFFGGGDADANGLQNFFGTSAAAPHAAAVAALLKQAVPFLTASQIYTALQNTALDMSTAGFDYDTGYGLVQTDAALAAVAGVSISGTVFNDSNGNGVRDSGESGQQAVTVFLDSNANGQPDAGNSGSRNSTDVPKAIPDFGAPLAGFPSRVTSSLVVSGLTGRVTKVTATINVTHSYDRNLGITLISPSGLRISLAANAGGSGQNYTNTTFDDASGTYILSGAAPFSGTYHPDVALSALIGENPNGTWQLEARDYAAGNTGTINSWSLSISYADPAAATDSSGNYSFSGLAPSAYYGIYHLRQTPPATYTQSAPAVPFDLTLTAGTQASNELFGNRLIDTVPPTVSGITLLDANPTNAATLHYGVLFSETVTGVDSSAFALSGTGTSGIISSVLGSGASYTIVVTGAAGTGTLGLDVVDHDTIHDLAGNPLGGVGGGNGNFTGPAYTIDTTPPVLTGMESSSLAYNGGAAPVSITSSLVVTDAGDNLAGATVAISAGFDSGQDVLAFVAQNRITGSYAAATGILTLTGLSSPANYQTALQSVTFATTPQAPGGSSRTISFMAFDQVGNSSASVSRGITVTAVDQPPNPNISGTNGDDAYYLQLDPAAQFLLLWTNATAAGSPAYSYPAAAVNSLTFHTADGNDSLTIDGANGNPVPNGGLTFDGGLGINTLTLKNPGSTLDATVAAAQVLLGTNPISLTNISSFALDSSAAQPILLHTLAITDVTVAMPPSADNVLRTSSLTFGGAGTLNLGNGSLIIDALPGGPPADVGTAIGDDIAAGRIVSTLSSPNHGLAAILNDDGTGHTIFDSFAGQSPVFANSILVQYALNGDSDFSGTIDGDDYFRIDIGQMRSASGYRNGDFNYDHVINADDYFLIDSAFMGQFPSPAPAMAAAPVTRAVTTVKKPAAASAKPAIHHAKPHAHAKKS